jgi:di/tricarboxylate transporter
MSPEHNAPPPQSGAHQPVSAKVLILAIVVVSYGLTIAVVAQAYSKTLAVLMAAPLIALIFVSVGRMPQAQQKLLAERLAKHEASPFGRLMKVAQYILAAVLVWGLAQWLLGEFR